MIGVDAAVNVSATSISTVGSLSADILNNQKRSKSSGALMSSLILAGDLTTTERRDLCDLE